jgi:hypothetical protein
VGVTEEAQKTKLSDGGKGDGGDVDADRLRGGENSTKVILYNVYGGKEGMSGDNRVEEGIDSEKGGCVGPYFIVYVYLVSAYCPSHSSLSQSHLVPLLLHYPFKVGRCFGRADDRKEALEGDQELI